jgi:hypothetical protein
MSFDLGRPYVFKPLLFQYGGRAVPFIRHTHLNPRRAIEGVPAPNMKRQQEDGNFNGEGIAQAMGQHV